jgi:predicted peroxiredoxin
MLKTVNSTSALLLSSLVGLSITFAIPSWANEIIVSQEAPRAPIAANNKNPSLFVNLTSDDVHRAGMAISFAQSVLKTGHQATIFLNVTAVRIASKNIPQHINGITKTSLQEMLREFIGQGGKVISCPMCLQQAGITPEQLIEGVVVGSPDITQPLLFADDVRVMSW